MALRVGRPRTTVTRGTRVVRRKEPQQEQQGQEQQKQKQQGRRPPRRLVALWISVAQVKVTAPWIPRPEPKQQREHLLLRRRIRQEQEQQHIDDWRPCCFVPVPPPKTATTRKTTTITTRTTTTTTCHRTRKPTFLSSFGSYNMTTESSINPSNELKGPDSIRPRPLLDEREEEEEEETWMDQLLDDDQYCEVVDEFGCTAYECIGDHNDDEQEQQRQQQSNTDTDQDPMAASTTAVAANTAATSVTTTSTTATTTPPVYQRRKRWIRLEKTVDCEVQPLQSTRDVWQRIQAVQNEQSQLGRADLYSRTWIRDHDNDSRSNRRKPNGCTEKEEKNMLFTMLQFNMLAEGLSAGPNALVPFQSSKSSSPKKNGTTATTAGGGGAAATETATTIPFNADEKDEATKKKDKDAKNTTTISNTDQSSMATHHKSCSKAYYGGFSDLPYPEATLTFAKRRWRLLEVILGGGISTDSYSNNATPQSIEQHQRQPADLMGDNDAPFDIVALEEVDRYGGFVGPILTQHFGYHGLFAPKVQSPGIKIGWYSDGCALFWKASIFALVHVEEQEVPSPTTTRQDMSEEEDKTRTPRRRQRRKHIIEYQAGTSQVLVLVTLRHLATGQDIVVAVTHLKAGAQEKKKSSLSQEQQQQLATYSSTTPGTTDTTTAKNKNNDSGPPPVTDEQVRVAQVGQLVDEIDALQQVHRKQRQQLPQDDDDDDDSRWPLPVLIAGDFNADPPNYHHDDDDGNCLTNEDSLISSTTSAIGRLLNHRLADPIVERAQSNHDDKDNHRRRCVTTAFQSAYPEVMKRNHNDDKEKFYTTWKTRGPTTTQRAIDYIFYHSGSGGTRRRRRGGEAKGIHGSGKTMKEGRGGEDCPTQGHRLECRARLSIPKGAELEASKLPGLRYPSDHLAVAAQFELLPQYDDDDENKNDSSLSSSPSPNS